MGSSSRLCRHRQHQPVLFLGRTDTGNNSLLYKGWRWPWRTRPRLCSCSHCLGLGFLSISKENQRSHTCWKVCQMLYLVSPPILNLELFCCRRDAMRVRRSIPEQGIGRINGQCLPCSHNQSWWNFGFSLIGKRLWRGAYEIPLHHHNLPPLF